MNAVISIVKTVIGILFTFFGAIMAIAFLADSSGRGVAEFIVVAAFLGIGLLLLIKKTKYEKNRIIARKQINTDKKLRISEEKQRVQECNAKSLMGKHITGLPITQGAECNIYFDSGQISISGTGAKINLDTNRLVSVDVKSETEIQNAYVSSIGGAVGGAVLFGPLGAMVGGRAKKKTTTKVEYFMIITYTKGEKIEYISFEIDESLLVKAKNIASRYDKKEMQINL